MPITYRIESTDGTDHGVDGINAIEFEHTAEQCVRMLEGYNPGHGWHVVPQGEAEVITAHIRRPNPRTTRNEAYGEWKRRQRDMFRADFEVKHQGTYCGADITTVDWDRRTAVSKSHAANAERECCPNCLRIAREESSK